MIVTWLDAAVKKEQYNELLRQAEEERLFRTLQKNGARKKWQLLVAAIFNHL